MVRYRTAKGYVTLGFFEHTDEVREVEGERREEGCCILLLPGVWAWVLAVRVFVPKVWPLPPPSTRRKIRAFLAGGKEEMSTMCIGGIAWTWTAKGIIIPWYSLVFPVISSFPLFRLVFYFHICLESFTHLQ